MKKLRSFDQIFSFLFYHDWYWLLWLWQFLIESFLFDNFLKYWSCWSMLVCSIGRFVAWPIKCKIHRKLFEVMNTGLVLWLDKPHLCRITAFHCKKYYTYNSKAAKFSGWTILLVTGYFRNGSVNSKPGPPTRTCHFLFRTEQVQAPQWGQFIIQNIHSEVLGLKSANKNKLNKLRGNVH